jgi:uncharacterized protein (TIGR03790 family)
VLLALAGSLLVFAGLLPAQTAANVLLVVNETDSLSRRIGDYYIHKRGIPLKNVCRLDVSSAETISWETYQTRIEAPVGAYLRRYRLADQVLYIVTTMGVPLKISGEGSGLEAEGASVDSELTLLYAKSKGVYFARAGIVRNQFFGQMNAKFTHARFPIYLVTRLAGYDFEDVKGIIDRAAVAKNRGKFVIDLRSTDSTPGNEWLRQAAERLPRGRVVLDDTSRVLSGLDGVIGYAYWGSNDPDCKRRSPGFHWLPGAIMTEYVSTDGRTFRRPPDSWTIGTWKKPAGWFAGAPQNLTADYIHEGVTGASGHVAEPYLAGTPRPNYLLPAYAGGRNLAESYYLAIPWLSWQNIVIGDPLCRLRAPD